MKRDNDKIIADSGNPYNSSSGTQAISNHELNHNKSEGSSCSSMRRTIEHSDNCDAAYFSDENIIPTYNGKNSSSTESTNYTYPRPGRKLIDFALRLVVLNKTRSGVGMLAFIWATVVLLGGFASTLKKIDFWFIATIIFVIGTGVFSQSHQLELRFFFQAAKATYSKIGSIISFFQLSSACVSIAFSLTRLIEQNYSDHDGQTNMKAALSIFYALALTDAFIFLIEKAYWIWTVSYLKIIEKVCKECGFGRSGVVPLRRFFHESYWRLTKGSEFLSLDVDLITFAQGLLVSNSRCDQLIAVRLFHGLISHEKFSHEIHSRIRTSTETISRLFQMLSWCNTGEKEIQIFSAKIVVVLASKLQLECIPEAMDCICSLLKEEDGLNQKTILQNSLGLEILTNLAGNPMNCLKIIEKTVLVSQVVDCTRFIVCTLDIKDKVKFTMVKKSLMLLKKIVSTNGKPGQIIRREISEISSIVNNFRNILKYSGKESVLFMTVIEILTALSMDKGAQKKIGSTNGIIRILLSTFLNSSDMKHYHRLRSNAGDALAMLTLQSERNCSEILKENADVVKQLTVILYTEEEYQSTVMKILTSMCAFSGTKWHDNFRQLISALPWVLKTILSSHAAEEVLEASVGLCMQISKFTSIEEFTQVAIREASFSMIDFAGRIQIILEENIYPNANIPCLRRHVIELIIWIMKSIDPLIQYFKEAGMEKILVQIDETTAEFENFHYFGVMEHPKTISSLILEAKVLLA